MEIEQLIKGFRNAAVAKGTGVGGAEDARLHKLMAEIYVKLKNAGEKGLLAFEKLLEDPSPHVRCWVGAQLLFSGNMRAKRVLEEISKTGGVVGLNAKMTLKEFENGRLGSPF